MWNKTEHYGYGYYSINLFAWTYVYDVELFLNGHTLKSMCYPYELFLV